MFFSEIFTAHNFLYVWYFMNEYVNYENFSALDQFYIRCKLSILSQVIS